MHRKNSLSRLNLTIRHASKNDAALLSKMGARLFKDAFGPANRPEDIAIYLSENFSLDQIQKELRDSSSTFLLAYRERKPIGYAKLSDQNKPECSNSPAPIELARIYVDFHQTNKGYGTALMRACIEEAERRGYKTIWLGVWEENEPAIRFYKRWGFRPVGTQKFELGNDIQNDLVMERPVALNLQFTIDS